MKKLYTLLVFAMGFFGASAQIENPVTWSYSVKKITADTYELHMTATVQPKWHIYAQEAGEGPEPTAFIFDKHPLLKLEGNVVELGKLEKQYDPNFKSTLRYYSDKVDFVQKIKLKTPVATVAKGTITFMACNERRCTPPKDVPFSIKINPKA